MRRLNDQKKKNFAFNKNERDNQIDKDNMNLLEKLEVIKKKGTNLAKKRPNKSMHEAFVDPDRIRSEHQRFQVTNRAAQAKKLDY